MSKVKKITVSNLKAISSQVADFDGCTAIITGGNNKGKTSFLRSLPDRLRGIKPDVILKSGESEGSAIFAVIPKAMAVRVNEALAIVKQVIIQDSKTLL